MGTEHGARPHGHRNTTAATSESLQKSVASSRRVRENPPTGTAERSKKPNLAIYVRSTPVNQASVRLSSPRMRIAQDHVRVDLFLRPRRRACQPIQTSHTRPAGRVCRLTVCAGSRIRLNLSQFGKNGPNPDGHPRSGNALVLMP